MLAYRHPDTSDWTEWRYPQRLPDGRLPPKAAERSFSEPGLADLGLRKVIHDPVPAGKIATGWALTDVDGAPHWTPTLEDIPLATLAAQKSAAVTAKRDALISGGVSVDFGGDVGPKVLQTATEYDRMNWLTILSAAQAFAAMGAGDQPMNPIRTADNVMIPVTVNEAIGHMLAIQTKAGAVWKHAADLKDAIAAAEDQAALDAIDIEAGWPDPLA